MHQNNVRYYFTVFITALCIHLSVTDNCDDLDVLSDAANRISDGENQLLKNIYSSLSYYEIQKYKNDFNFDNNDEISQKLEITHNNLEEVLNLIKSFEITDLSDFNNLTLSKSEVEKLSYVLDLTLNKNVLTNCTDSYLLIYGHFISLKSIKELSKVSNNCEKLPLKRLVSLRFFSFNTIFIDADFNITEEPFKNIREVSFIAPKFQVIGSRKFNFDVLEDEKGISFFGVAGRIIDRQNLQITAESGIGEPEDINLFDLEENSYTKGQGIYVKDSEGGTAEIKDVIAVSKIVNHYQSYFRINFDVNHREFHHLDFLEKLNRVVNFYDFSNVLGLPEELEVLTSESDDSDTETDFSPFYQLLLDRIDIHAQFFKGSKRSDDFLLLRCLYAATLSMKNHLQDTVSTGLISDVPKHFERLKEEFNILQSEINNKANVELKKKIRSVIKQRIEDFDKNIESEISTANETISEKIMEELKYINGELNNSMSALVVEIDERQKNATEAGKELEKEKSNLLKDACLQTAFGVLNIVATGLSFAGPIGMAAGATISAGTMIGKTILAKDQAARAEKLQKIIPDLNKNVAELKKRVEAKKTRELDNLEEAVEGVKKETESNKMNLKPEDKAKLKKYMESRKEDIRTWKKDIKKVSFENIKGIKKEVYVKIKTNCQKLIEPGKLDKMSKSLEKLSVVSEMSSLALDIYNTWDGYAKGNEKMKNSIAANDKIMDGLKDFKESINTDIMPDLEKLVNKISEAVENIADKSKVDFSLVKFDAEKIFAKTRKYLNDVIAGTYKMKDSLMQTVDKLEKMLPLLFNTNGVIQDFKQERNLADFLSGISYERMNAGGNRHEDTIRKLDVLIHSNILLKEYKIAYHALEQFTFPFVDDFLAIKDHPSEFQIEGDISSSVTDVKDQLDAITKKLYEYRNFLLPGNAGVRLYTEHFGPKDGVTLRPPFYIWRNEEHREAVARLLRGQEVVLYADIDKKLPKFDGIKIKGIDFYLRSRNREAELNALLNKFEITFHHLGNSYYTLNGETYMIKTSDLAFHYAFVRKDQPQDRITNYQKLKEGDFMLSPYALWKVVVENNMDDDYSELMQYEDVDLELRGYGVHINRKVPVQNSLNYKYVKLCKKLNESLPQAGRH